MQKNYLKIHTTELINKPMATIRPKLTGRLDDPAELPRVDVSDAGLSPSDVLEEVVVCPTLDWVEVVVDVLPLVVEELVVEGLVVEVADDVVAVADDDDEVVEVVVAGPPPGRGTCTVAPAP